MMLIGCLCVTEGRAAVFPLALESFRWQTHREAKLLVAHRGPAEEEPAYRGVLRPGEMYRAMRMFGSGRTVVQDIASGFRTLLAHGCCAVAVWDDDDFSPIDRLYRTMIALEELVKANVAAVCGYREGWFVNARTWQGHLLANDDGRLWGATLGMTRALVEKVLPLLPKAQCPGYDKLFHEQADVLVPFEDVGVPPVAFSHGKNIATWLREPGEPMEAKLRSWMPSMVFEAAERFRGMLVERRVYPPQPEGK